MDLEPDPRKRWEMMLQLTSQELLLLLGVLEKKPGGWRLVAHMRLIVDADEFVCAYDEELALEAAMHGLIPAKAEMEERRRESRKRARERGTPAEEGDQLDLWREEGEICVRYGPWAMEWHPPTAPKKSPVTAVMPAPPDSPLPESVVVKREESESGTLAEIDVPERAKEERKDEVETAVKGGPPESWGSFFEFTLRYSPIDSPPEEVTEEASDGTIGTQVPPPSTTESNAESDTRINEGNNEYDDQ